MSDCVFKKFHNESRLKLVQIDYFPGQVMQNDLDTLGYVLEHGRVDSKHFLLPQRRNRVYATADVGNGQCASMYKYNMEKTMQAMSSDSTIPIDAILDSSLPREELSTERQALKLKEAMESASKLGHGKHVFFDGSTSSSRPAEFAVDTLTCIRPTHGIYCESHSRWVTVEEMWKAQGLWATNFNNPDAVTKFLTLAKDAHDMVGNAFSSTVAQAKVIASMIHSTGWENIKGIEVYQPQSGTVVVSELDHFCEGLRDEYQDNTSGYATPTVSKASGLKRSSSSISCDLAATRPPPPLCDAQPIPCKRRRYTKKSNPRIPEDVLPTSCL